MADVEISYKGNEIATMSATGVKTLLTGDMFCEDDIIVSYTKPSAPAPILQTKSETYTPTTSQQTDSITADVGYDGLDQVDITINAVATGTAGTPTATKGTVSSHSIAVTPSVTNTTGYITGGTINGTAVTVSASELVSGTLSITSSGTKDVTNYASASVASGSATTPATTITANPTISVSSSGLITASVSGSQSVTPSVSAGYVSSGTVGTVTVNGSATSQLTVYNGEHHQPTPSGYTVTVSLTNPVNASRFYSFEINEANNSTDYNNMNKLGEITSPTGSTTITVDTNLYGICLSALGVGAYQYYSASNISCTGGATLANKAINAVIAVTGDGTVTIDGINWYDD